MPSFPSRFRRLDGILADLQVDDPMLLTELDGYLTSIAVCPEPIMPGAWLPPIWGGGYGESAPFDEPADVPLFADMVAARHAEILRDLGRGRLQPIFDVDERNGEVLWEAWVAGFDMVMGLWPDGWAAVAAGGDTDAATALSVMHTLAEVASDETALTSDEINRICDEAPGLIPGYVAHLYAVRAGRGGAASPADPPAKVGRNDPCPCGSGKKHKRCCG